MKIDPKILEECAKAIANLFYDEAWESEIKNRALRTEQAQVAIETYERLKSSP